MSVINIKVSVIIPTYKRGAKYLSRAIDSVKNQTYKNIEIVIVDDNPPDSDYRKQIRHFMQQYYMDSDVVYITNPNNLGGSLARNRGIRAATGEYITFLDDDDEYLPKKVERQLAFMIKNECDMSFTNMILVNKNKNVIDYREYKKLPNFDNITLLKYHLTRHLTGTPTFMYKAEKLKEIGGFDDVKMGQEFHLMLKSIENNLNINYLNECDVIAYRDSSEGISLGKNKIEGENFLYEFKKRYFQILNRRERIFIHFRHHAVMVIAYMRNKNYFHALISGVRMAIVSPIDFIIEVFNYIKNMIKYRNTKILRQCTYMKK